MQAKARNKKLDQLLSNQQQLGAVVRVSPEEVRAPCGPRPSVTAPRTPPPPCRPQPPKSPLEKSADYFFSPGAATAPSAAAAPCGLEATPPSPLEKSGAVFFAKPLHPEEGLLIGEAAVGSEPPTNQVERSTPPEVKQAAQGGEACPVASSPEGIGSLFAWDGEASAKMEPSGVAGEKPALAALEVGGGGQGHATSQTLAERGEGSVMYWDGEGLGDDAFDDGGSPSYIS